MSAPTLINTSLQRGNGYSNQNPERMKSYQPRVARNELPWERRHKKHFPSPRFCVAGRGSGRGVRITLPTALLDLPLFNPLQNFRRDPPQRKPRTSTNTRIPLPSNLI